MSKQYLYLRGLRQVDHSVFCVSKGQKTYWSAQFDREVAFSSGQQVKRSIMEAILSDLDESFSPTTFNSKISGKKIERKQAFSICDPSYVDQLLGGWMLAKSKQDKGKSKTRKEDDTDEAEESEIEEGDEGKSKTIKRRSPLSISAMRPLHPLLAGTVEENISFDRTGQPTTYDSEDQSGAHKIVVRNSTGNIMPAEEVQRFIDANDLPPVPARLYIFSDKKDKKKSANIRSSGLFIYDIAVDLRRLFSVSLDANDQELDKDTIEKLRKNNWIESRNVLGRCLVCPKDRRERIIAAFAHALLNWRITSNQSRTFSLMETLAIAISDNANKIASAIRAKLSEESTNPRAIPLIDDAVGAELFIALPCDGYIQGVHGTATALEDAEKRIAGVLSNFDYEKQMTA